jgi:ATP-dependent DNA helicase RecQ
LSTVVRLERERRQRYGAGQLIDILRGHATDRTRQHRHETLSTWGIGADLSEAQWRAVARQLLARGDLAVAPGAQGALAATDRSWQVLRGQRRVTLRQDLPTRRPAGAKAAAAKAAAAPLAELSEADQAVFDQLRIWRSQQARDRGVPPYVVFHDSTLRAIAAARPTTLEELAAAPGVGQKKLETYGPEVLELVSRGLPAAAGENSETDPSPDPPPPGG